MFLTLQYLDGKPMLVNTDHIAFAEPREVPVEVEAGPVVETRPATAIHMASGRVVYTLATLDDLTRMIVGGYAR